MGLKIVSARLPTGDQPVCGVVLEPYILFRENDTDAVVTAQIPEENSPEGSSSRYRLRSRWYRQSFRSTCACSVHPEKDAKMQCLLCLKAGVPVALSFHCSSDCLQRHWELHKSYHERYREIAEQNAGMENGQLSNGSGGIHYPNYCYSHRNNGFRGPPQVSNDQEMVEVGRSRCYEPTPEDVGCVLKFECSIIDSQSSLYGNQEERPSVTTTASVRPAPSPPVRGIMPVNRGTVLASNEGKFTVLTYNILADLYATQGDMYQSYCPNWALSWHYRKQNIVKEVTSYKADVVCLQEVQSNHYEEFLLGALESRGYCGVFKRKTNEMFVGKSLAIDGCATFYRKDRFTLIKKYEVEFNKAAVSTANHYPEPQRNAALQRLSKDNVALIVVLESVQPMLGHQKQLICVANTHIHSNPEHSDVKVWQVHTLLKGLEKIAASAEIPIIVAGDFNSEPGSAAHALLVNQSIDHTHPETTNDPTQFLTALLPVKHKLPLRSAYSSMFTNGNMKDPGLEQQQMRMDAKLREPLFTNFTRDYKGTLDYIFYTPTLLMPTALLELPAENLGCQDPDDHIDSQSIQYGLPNRRFSSDHICLMAEFQLLYPFEQPPI